MATEDRLADAGWWPTKTTEPRDSFAGRETCVQCHAEQASTQPLTPMGMAGRRAEDADLFRIHPSLTYLTPPHSFLITSADGTTSYSITDGKQALSRPIAWVFGSGEFGQTFLYESQNHWFESQVSFYKSLGALDLTTGHVAKPDAGLDQALGTQLQSKDAQHCFQCHTTLASVNGEFDPKRAIGGLGCEACHGPALAHVSRMQGESDGKTSAGAPSQSARLMDLKKLSPVDSVDFCGACHRTWADIAFSQQQNMGLDVVRFQPYRLEKSKCWGKNGDNRITCIACHDPHKPLEHDTSVYDRQCQTCHALKSAIQSPSARMPGKACPVSSTRCTSCHMPKYKVASMHGDFTDHWIRVVQAGEVFPK